METIHLNVVPKYIASGFRSADQVLELCRSVLVAAVEVRRSTALPAPSLVYFIRDGVCLYLQGLDHPVPEVRWQALRIVRESLRPEYVLWLSEGWMAQGMTADGPPAGPVESIPGAREVLLCAADGADLCVQLHAPLGPGPMDVGEVVEWHPDSGEGDAFNLSGRWAGVN